MYGETDPMLRRFERNALLAALAMAVVAAVAGRFDVALGVAGGTLLAATGYAAIKDAVTVLARSAAGATGEIERRRVGGNRAWMMVRFVGRYALLALAAYVMLVRLHVHPVGLLLGVSAPVVAAAVEAARILRRPRA